jgi:hypothetical protein
VKSSFVVFAFALSLVACDSSDSPCNLDGTNPLSVSLVDATTGASICDATVTLTLGNATYTIGGDDLGDGGEGGSCVYDDVPIAVQSGTYTVTATAPGFASAHQDGVALAFSTDPCGSYATSTVSVTLTLSASP